MVSAPKLGEDVLTSQLGYRPGRPQPVIIRSASTDARLTVRVNSGYSRAPRTGRTPAGWQSERFEWPFDAMAGEWAPHRGPAPAAELICQAIDTRWGRFFLGHLPPLPDGLYTLETEGALGLPFEIRSDIYQRIVRGYLAYLGDQRSGEEIPGVRAAWNLDDARRDTDGVQIVAAGGWYDAGDHRQWTSTTALHLSALAEIVLHAPTALGRRAADELDWGLDYFLHLVNDQGRVPDNVGGGTLPPGFDMSTWWFENHSGTACDDAGSAPTDGRILSGDERIALMLRNLHAENIVIRELARAVGVVSPVQSARARVLAARVWQKSSDDQSDARTLFLASRLRAAVALHQIEPSVVPLAEVEQLVRRLLERQHPSAEAPAVGSFFVEENGEDAFRSIPYSCEPPLALLDALTVVSEDLHASVRHAIARHIDEYLVRDAQSNPFGLPPHGAYLRPEHEDRQLFRSADAGSASVRTFMAPWNRDRIVHGTSAVLAHQSLLLARAGLEWGRSDWVDVAEGILRWFTGANTEGMSLYTDIGYRRPVVFSPRAVNVTGALMNGFVGRPDDTPYLETSTAVAWNTQEIYGVATVYAAQAARLLSGWYP